MPSSRLVALDAAIATTMRKYFSTCRPRRGTNTILVAHILNFPIPPLDPIFGTQVEAETIVVKPLRDDKFEIVGRIPVEKWAAPRTEVATRAQVRIPDGLCPGTTIDRLRRASIPRAHRDTLVIPANKGASRLHGCRDVFLDRLRRLGQWRLMLHGAFDLGRDPLEHLAIGQQSVMTDPGERDVLRARQHRRGLRRDHRIVPRP